MVGVTTAEDVKLLFPNEKPTINVDIHVADANIWVSELFATTTLSDERTSFIARYLAAHFVVLAQQEGGIFEEKMGESTVKTGSTSTLGQGLRLTRFGQTALGADTTGALAQLEGGTMKTALFRVV